MRRRRGHDGQVGAAGASPHPALKNVWTECIQPCIVAVVLVLFFDIGDGASAMVNGKWLMSGTDWAKGKAARETFGRYPCEVGDPRTTAAARPYGASLPGSVREESLPQNIKTTKRSQFF